MSIMWKKVLLAAALAAFATTAVMADDLPSFDTPSDNSIPGFGDESSSLPGFESDSGSASSSSFGAASSALAISGEGGASSRWFLAGASDIEDRAVQMDPYFRLNFSYSGSIGEVEAKLKVNERILKDNPEDVIDELTLRAYLGDFVLEAGKMKLVWGKGDKVHVLDNFNSDDYSDFIFPDYIDRRIAVPMVHVAYNMDNGMRLEGAYTPYMTGTRYASSGPWVPERTLLGAYQAADRAAKETPYYGSLYTEPTLGSFSATKLYGIYKDNLPDTRTLKYGQFGLRATGTVGSFDWGASYFYGRMKDSSIHSAELVRMLLNAGCSSVPSPLPFPLPVGQLYDYDRMQVFGLEGATVIGGFNFRAELGYFLTDDVDGDDPYVHNNSLQWVFGFDRDLPWNNLNVNIQTQGKYILHGDDVKDNGVGDVDYNGEKAWVQNRLVLDITDSWMHEKLKPELKLVWNIELEDVVVMPQVSYQLMEGLDVSLAGLYIYSGDNGQFYDFKDNSFVQVGAVYKF